jgi:hypothetical protein
MSFYSRRRCMGCKIYLDEDNIGAFCESCRYRYKVKFINNDIKIQNDRQNDIQILQTKENKKKLMIDLLSAKSSSNINIEEIKIKIEADAEKKVIELYNTKLDDFKKPDVGDLLLNIMKAGSDEFKEKTGRNMTYSEMRYMFG